MSLLVALGLPTVEHFDSGRPFQIGSRVLGLEAAAEAERCLTSTNSVLEVQVRSRVSPRPYYWRVQHSLGGSAEIFCLPTELSILPTDIEVAIVRAIHVADSSDQERILAGGVEVSLGARSATNVMRHILDLMDHTDCVRTTALVTGRNVSVDEQADNLIGTVILACLLNSLKLQPTKYRFVELYRSLEARFRDDVKQRLLLAFSQHPISALEVALKSLRSELKQILGLAERQKPHFERIWLNIVSMKDTRPFAHAIWNRTQEKLKQLRADWQLGAGAIYQIRCAIVHSAESDVIYENFPDADTVIDDIILDVEQISLNLCGLLIS